MNMRVKDFLAGCVADIRSKIKSADRRVLAANCLSAAQGQLVNGFALFRISFENIRYMTLGNDQRV